MAIYFATIDGKTLKIIRNRQGNLKEISLIENKRTLMIWQYLDLLSEIMPKYLHAYTDIIKVDLKASNGHTCLVVTQGDIIRNYHLDHPVSDCWILSANSARLNAIIYWWRCNRSQYEEPISPWGIWRNED